MHHHFHRPLCHFLCRHFAVTTLETSLVFHTSLMMIVDSNWMVTVRRSNVSIRFVVTGMLFVHVIMKLLVVTFPPRAHHYSRVLTRWFSYLSCILTGAVFAWVLCYFMLRYRSTWVLVENCKLICGQSNTLDTTTVCHVVRPGWESLKTVCLDMIDRLFRSREQSCTESGNMHSAVDETQLSNTTPVLMQRMERAEPMEPETTDSKKV